jgi:hypothetical protein
MDRSTSRSSITKQWIENKRRSYLRLKWQNKLLYTLRISHGGTKPLALACRFVAFRCVRVPIHSKSQRSFSEVERISK